MGFLARLFPDSHEEVLAAVRASRAPDGSLKPIQAHTGTQQLELTPGRGETWMLGVRDCTTESDALALRFSDLGTLLPGCAHDLNNVLTILAHSVAPEDLPPERRESILSSHESQLRHGRALIRAISRMGRDSSVCSPHDPMELLSRFCQIFSSPAHRMTLRIDPPTEPACYIHVSTLRLERVLFNLLVNAQNAATHRGSLTFSLHRWAADKVAARTEGRLSKPCVCIEARDSGPGIPLEVLPRIFEEGFTTRPGVGDGLGLANARMLMRSFGGEILAANAAVGGGAVFYLLFPEPEPS